MNSKNFFAELKGRKARFRDTSCNVGLDHGILNLLDNRRTICHDFDKIVP